MDEGWFLGGVVLLILVGAAIAAFLFYLRRRDDDPMRRAARRYGAGRIEQVEFERIQRDLAHGAVPATLGETQADSTDDSAPPDPTV